DSGDATAQAWDSAARAVLDDLALDGPWVVGGLLRAETFFEERTLGNGWGLDSLKLIRAMTLWVLGDLEALRVTFPRDLADARRRHDRYLETSMRRGGVMVWLCDGDVEEARRAVEETAWSA